MILSYHVFFYVCADNIWTDQNLLLDPDLPSGWRTIKDSTGTYYWHVPTGATQWQHPSLNGPPQLLDTQVRPPLNIQANAVSSGSFDAFSSSVVLHYSRRRQDSRTPTVRQMDLLRPGNTHTHTHTHTVSIMVI